MKALIIVYKIPGVSFPIELGELKRDCRDEEIGSPRGGNREEVCGRWRERKRIKIEKGGGDREMEECVEKERVF